MNDGPSALNSLDDQSLLRLTVSKLCFFLWNLPFVLLGYLVVASALWVLDTDASSFLAWALVLVLVGYVLYVSLLDRGRYELVVSKDFVEALSGQRGYSSQRVKAPLSWRWNSAWNTWPFRMLEVRNADAVTYIPAVLYASNDLKRLEHALEGMLGR